MPGNKRLNRVNWSSRSKGGVLGFLVMVSALMISGSAAAQPADPLADAEAAYAAVDFERTLDLAQEALESGRLDPVQLARAYKLIGISAAALRQNDRGREAFVRMLAFEPDARLEENLSPTLRAPYMEARGFWATHPDRLGASVALALQRGALRIDLNDPLGMGETVVVRARIEGEEEFIESQVPAAERTYVEVDGADEEGRVEFSYIILDEHGNRILALGDDEIPEVVGTASDNGRPVARSAWFWAVMGVTVAAVAGGVTAGVILWNQSETPSVATNVSTVF